MRRFNGDLFTAFQNDGDGENRVSSERFDLVFDLPCKRTESGSRLGPINGPAIDINDFRFGVSSPCTKALTGGLLVGFEIIASTVGDANAFHPAVRPMQFNVPTIQGVMGHLVPIVLPESHLRGEYAKGHHEVVGPGHEPSHGRVEDDTVSQGLRDGTLERVAFGGDKLNRGL